MMSNIQRKDQERALDVVNAVVGVCLALSPWVLGFTGDRMAAWDAWLVGAAIVLVAIGALVAFAQWEEWANLVLGIWAVVASWVLGFASLSAAVYVHVIAGLIVAVLAAVELWLVRHHPVSAT